MAECVNVVEGKYEPGKGEFIEINRQIEARQKELRKNGYSYRKINEDAQLDKLKRKADRLYELFLPGRRVLQRHGILGPHRNEGTAGGGGRTDIAAEQRLFNGTDENGTDKIADPAGFA